MSQNMQGFHGQNNSDHLFTGSSQQFNAVGSATQQTSQVLPGSGLTPAMLLPNQPFGLLRPPGGGSGNVSNSNGFVSGSTQGCFDVNAELKRLQQQLQQQFGSSEPTQTSLLFPEANTAINQSSTVSNQTAILLSMLEQQKVQNNQLMGAAGWNTPIFAQPGLFQDSGRLFLGQNPLGGAIPQHNMIADIGLPSPHELFQRDGTRRMRGGVIELFPEKLHRLLNEVEAAGRSDVVSYVANGRAFAIHKPDKFFKEIVPLYFRQSRLSSFKRQLNLYGFELINTGASRGGYFHELFVRDRPDLCRRMRRVAVKLSSNKTGKQQDDESGEEDEKEVKDSSATEALDQGNGDNAGQQQINNAKEDARDTTEGFRSSNLPEHFDSDRH